MLLLLVAFAAPGVAQGPSDPIGPTARIVVLVDESGSLSAEQVSQERAAVALLAQNELSARSEIAVLGFGSSNGPGQNAVTRYCDFISLDTPRNREALGDCGNRIHPRDSEEGANTDHVAALKAGIELFGDEQDDRSRIILLLTDGKLDVRESPQYGPEADRQAEAERRLTDEQLPLAQERGIQIWPIGFGDASQEDLERFAVAGATGTEVCGAQNIPRPEALFAESVSTVTDVALLALARGNCSGLGPVQPGVVPEGGEQKLEVVIPAIASHGVISVTKEDSRIEVTYLDPDGTDVLMGGLLDGQELTVSGQDSPVEGLNITNPKTGTWTVVLRAPPGVGPVPVTARALWRGAVRSVIQVSPIVARPGDRMDVQVRLRTALDIVTDPTALQGLAITAEVEGKGFASFPVELAQGDDASLNGEFVIPDEASGDVTVVAHVSGDGVVDDSRPYSFSVQPDRFLSVDVTLPTLETVAPGETVQVTIAVNNQGDPVSARLALTDLTEGAQVRIEPTSLEFLGGQSEHEFTITIDPDTSLGQLSGTVEVATDEGEPLERASFVTTVEKPPTPVDYLLAAFPWVLGLVAITLVVAGVWLLRKSMKDVQFTLRDGTGRELGFAKVDDLFPNQQLRVAPADARDPEPLRLQRKAFADGAAYVAVTRNGSGFKVTRGDKPVLQVGSGEPVQVDDRYVEIKDPRSPRSPYRPQTDGAGPWEGPSQQPQVDDPGPGW